MSEKQHVNYLYFAIFFFLISFLHIYQIFLIESVTLFHRCFYIVYALGQCLLETGALVLIGNFLKKRIHHLFVVLTFLILLIHLIDFPLIRIMGMTVWYAIDMVFTQSFSNFIEMLIATNISLKVWLLAGITALLVPIIGMVFYHFTDRLSKKKPLYISYSSLGLTLFGTIFFITMLDFSTYRKTPFEQFLKVLPWKTTFLSISHPRLELEKALPRLPSEVDYLSQLQTLELVADKKPNIFLFIIESLRDDFLKTDTAPHLAKFQEDCGRFQNSIAAANATQTSWFSIYHSVYPFYWGRRQPEQWQSGSLPLQILKKMGYKIHLFSSARLEFYKMNEIIFGKDQYLADTFQLFAKDAEIYENDTACIDALLKSHDADSPGNLFLIFLDGTHFDYSCPKEEAFIPAPEKINYLRVACKAGIEGVKNRYRNSIHFLDRLMGRFFAEIEKEAVVVVTGDHGEEFLEQGNVFHASQLSSMQTRVPIYCRLGSFLPMSQELASHLDIFPTILHHILGEDLFTSWFDGESLLRPRQKNFVISSRYNGSRTPFEFLIHDGKYQLIARFDNRQDVLKARALHLISLRDEHNQPIDICVDRIQQDFKPALDALFKK